MVGTLEVILNDQIEFDKPFLQAFIFSSTEASFYHISLIFPYFLSALAFRSLLYTKFPGEDVEGFGYEEIESDEEELPEYQYEEEWLVDEWEDWLKPFNPSHFHMLELHYLVSPTLTDFEVEYQRWKARLKVEGQDLEEEPHQVSKEVVLISLMMLALM